MADKGKKKAQRVSRNAGDDDKHVRTDIRKSNIGSPMHMSQGGVNPEQARHLREPYRSQVLNRDVTYEDQGKAYDQYV